MYQPISKSGGYSSSSRISFITGPGRWLGNLPDPAGPGWAEGLAILPNLAAHPDDSDAGLPAVAAAMHRAHEVAVAAIADWDSP